MSITFEILETHPNVNDDELFSKIHINALYNNEQAGFVYIHYISHETYEAKLKTVLDFFIYKIYQGNEEVQELYKNRDKNLSSFVEHFKIHGKTIEDIESYVESTYSSSYNNFVNYWVNKPSRDLTLVFNDTCKFSHPISNGVTYKLAREPKNMRNLGVGKALLEKSLEVVSLKNLSLWESKTKTIQGEKFWKVSFDGFNILNSKTPDNDFPSGRKFSVKVK